MVRLVSLVRPRQQGRGLEGFVESSHVVFFWLWFKEDMYLQDPSRYPIVSALLLQSSLFELYTQGVNERWHVSHVPFQRILVLRKIHVFDMTFHLSNSFRNKSFWDNRMCGPFNCCCAGTLSRWVMDRGVRWLPQIDTNLDLLEKFGGWQLRCLHFKIYCIYI